MLACFLSFNYDIVFAKRLSLTNSEQKKKPKTAVAVAFITFTHTLGSEETARWTSK